MVKHDLNKKTCILLFIDILFIILFTTVLEYYYRYLFVFEYTYPNTT